MSQNRSLQQARLRHLFHPRSTTVRVRHLPSQVSLTRRLPATPSIHILPSFSNRHLSHPHPCHLPPSPRDQRRSFLLKTTHLNSNNSNRKHLFRTSLSRITLHHQAQLPWTLTPSPVSQHPSQWQKKIPQTPVPSHNPTLPLHPPKPSARKRPHHRCLPVAASCQERHSVLLPTPTAVLRPKALTSTSLST